MGQPRRGWDSHLLEYKRGKAGNKKRGLGKLRTVDFSSTDPHKREMMLEGTVF
jgi:hypothetical protein